MFLGIQIDLIILKTYDQQFTLPTKKSLHITFKGVCFIETSCMSACLSARLNENLYYILFKLGGYQPRAGSGAVSK